MDRSADFFENHPMFVVDRTTLEILDANSLAVEKFGYSKEELIGAKIDDFARLDGIGKDNGKGKHLKNVWEFQKKNGTNVYLQFTTHMFNYGGKPALFAVAHDVSDLVEEEVKNFNRYPRLASYMEHSPLAKIEWDNSNQIISWSDRAEELFGWKAEEVIENEEIFGKMIHPEDRQKVVDTYEEAVNEQKTSYITENRNITKEGKTLYCEWYSTLLYDQDGNLISVQSLVHDITDRMESEYMFRALSEESLVGVYLIQDGVFKYVNPKFAEIFHYSSPDALEHELGPLDLAHPEDRDLVEENLSKRLSGKTKSIEYDFRCVTKDEQVIYVNVYGTRITYLGKPAVIGTLVDITDRKLALEQYKASVESFEDLFDSISDGIYIQNREGKFMEINQGAVDMYGYDREFVIGKTPEVLAAPGKVDMEQTWMQFQKALEGEPQQFEWWGKRKNGEVFPKEVILNPGNYFGERVVIAIARDITERHEAEEKVRKNEELFRQLFQNAPVGIAMLDKHQEIRFVNEAFENIFGFPSEEIKGLDIDQIIVPPEGREEAKALSADIFSGKSSKLAARRKKKDGSLVDVLIYGVPVIVNGHTIAIFGIYVDITERRQAEEKIRRSLKEKEVLLAEIHHRVKNNLAVITGLLELQADNTSSDEATNVLRESQMRINSIALIHEKLYQSEDLSQISFDVYVRELTDIIVRSLIKEELEVDISIDSEEITLTITQAIPCGLILNELITNAYKHAFEGRSEGKISIKCYREDQRVVFIVEDNGVGLPDDLDLENPSSLGITLIRTLSAQIEADYAFMDTKEGTKFRMEFELNA